MKTAIKFKAMRKLIASCFDATTKEEVEAIVRGDFQLFEKYPELMIFPARALNRIEALERNKKENTPVYEMN